MRFFTFSTFEVLHHLCFSGPFPLAEAKHTLNLRTRDGTIFVQPLNHCRWFFFLLFVTVFKCLPQKAFLLATECYKLCSDGAPACSGPVRLVES